MKVLIAGAVLILATIILGFVGLVYAKAKTDIDTRLTHPTSGQVIVLYSGGHVVERYTSTGKARFYPAGVYFTDAKTGKEVKLRGTVSATPQLDQ